MLIYSDWFGRTEGPVELLVSNNYHYFNYYCKVKCHLRVKLTYIWFKNFLCTVRLYVGCIMLLFHLNVTER